MFHCREFVIEHAKNEQPVETFLEALQWRRKRGGLTFWRGGRVFVPPSVFDSFYRAMHFSAKRGIAIACRLSVCLSVCNVGEL